MKLILSNDPSLFSVSIDPTNAFSFEAQSLNHPRPTVNNSPLFGPTIVGSCNGLLCLNFSQGAILWNPSTRTHHNIPEPEDDAVFQQRRNWRSYVVHGLGYDEVNDDYKFVRVYQYLGPADGTKKFDTKVLVYSLRSDTWMRVADFPYFVHRRMMSDVFVNGVLHFHVSSKELGVGGDYDTVGSDCAIAGFDVSNHTYKFVTSLGVPGGKFGLELGVLGGSLSFILNADSGVSRCIVMKEDGSNSSWTRLFSVKKDASRGFRFRPISYFGGEKLILLEGDGEIFCFDIETSSLKDVEINGIDQPVEIFVCIESEVVLGSVDTDDMMQQEVNGENFEELVNEVILESGAVLGSVGINDEIQQVKEELNEENLGQQVNKKELERETVLGSVDGDDGGKMQLANEEANEENLERMSAERDLGST